MRFASLALILAVALAVPAHGQGTGNPTTSEVLVLTTATELTRTVTGGRRVAMEIQNLGPNAIFCAFSSAAAVVNKARMLAAKPASGAADSWAIDAWPDVRVWCIAATANQVTGAATVVSELLK